MRSVAWMVLLLVASGCLGGDPAAEPEATPDDPAPPRDDRPDDPALAQTGRWLAPFDAEVPAINMVLLHDGRILYWSGVEANQSDGASDLIFFNAVPVDAQSRVLNLSGPQPVVVTPINPDGAGSDLFCAGQTVLPDGRILAVGSSEWSTQPSTTPFLRGGTDARIFDPATDTWERKADMLFGRWYPSAITLPDGRALVASGIGSLTNVNEQWPQVEVYDPEADTWTYVEGADRLLPLYPRLTVVPGGPLKGHIFYNTVGTLWGPFGEHPRQAEWSFEQDLDLQNRTWQLQGPSTLGARQHAASIMGILDPERGYAPKFVTFGGSLYQSVAATPLTETIDLSTVPPTNQLGQPMANPRWHLNGVLLPDATILAVGGGLYDNVIAHGQENVPVLSAEQYDPATGAWTTLADMTVPRMYHSTALLLPDGRVLAGGHVPLPNPSSVLRGSANAQVVETRMQIFEPPYLFRGPRPLIEDAPSNVTFGSTFNVTVDDAARINDLVLMRPGATTHAFDADQRGIRLDFARNPDAANVLTVGAPPDGVVAPPGHYMLFAIGQGTGGDVPSVAAWVHLAAT